MPVRCADGTRSGRQTQPLKEQASGPGWRDHLHRLDGLGLVLLPIGAGADLKGPVDPHTGYGLKDWPLHPGCSSAEITGMDPRRVIAAGIHTGPSDLDVLDLDGPAAVEWIAAHGVDPRDPALFRITRTTDPDRFKIPFRLTPEQRELLPKGKTLLRVGEPDEKGKRQAVERYGQDGAQVVALGYHAKSGGWYDWSGDPSLIGPPSEAWLQVMIALQEEVTRLRGLGDTSRPPKARGCKVSGSWDISSHRHPCPVCGRDHSSACTRTTTTDGRLMVSCFHGGAFSPPTGLKAGEVVTGKDGGQWGFIETYDAKCLGEKSLFIDHRPRPREEITLANRTQQQATTTNSAPQKEAGAPAGELTEKKKTRRLRPDEVRDRIEKEAGAMRLNLRTGHIEAGGKALDGDGLGHLYLKLCTETETWGRETTADAAGYHARQNQFDPVRDWLEENTAEALPMDQWDAIEEQALGFADPINGAILRRFLIGAVARVMDPGCWWRVAPVLIGDQLKGKTEWIRALAGDAWFLSGVKKLDRDDVQRLRKGWLVELGELDGLTRKADQEALKAFLTERIDTYRAPYARSEESHPRRCVFIGTANASPLRDSTGSTRFACIDIGSRDLPIEWIKEHRAAIWKRALVEYHANPEKGWSHTQEELKAIAERNDDHTVKDPWLEELAPRLESMAKLGLPLQGAEIYGWLEVGLERQSSQTAERVGRIMQALGWEKARRRKAGERAKTQGWWPVLGTPGHGGGAQMGAQADGNQGKASQGVGTLGTPQTTKKGKQDETTPPTHHLVVVANDHQGVLNAENPVFSPQRSAQGDQHPQTPVPETVFAGHPSGHPPCAQGVPTPPRTLAAEGWKVAGPLALGRVPLVNAKGQTKTTLIEFLPDHGLSEADLASVEVAA